MLQIPETSKHICLSGSKDKPQRTKLVKHVVEILANDTLFKKLCRALKVFGTNLKCARKDAERPSGYVVSFYSALAIFFDQTGALASKTARKFSAQVI